MDPDSAVPSKPNPVTSIFAATADQATVDQASRNQATNEQPSGGRWLRPWGWYEVLAVGEGYQVKRLHLEPNRRFSLQRHHQRSEQWLVLAGQGVVQLGGNNLTVQPGQLLEVPIVCVHRASAGPEGLVILEVQRGDVLREDDIERLADDYGRCEPA